MIPALGLAAIFLLTMAAYSNTLDAPFVFDDGFYIEKNPFVNPDAGYAAVGGDYGLAHMSRTRPVGFLSFGMDFRRHGSGVRGYHVTNIAIHMVNVALAFLIANHIARQGGWQGCATWAALTCAVVFALHPVQTQAVTYISQRLTSLMSMFYMLAFLLYIVRGRVGARWAGWACYAMALIATALAMKTKESAFTLPVMLVAYELIFPAAGPTGGRLIRRLLVLAPFFLVALIVPIGFVIDGASFDDTVSRATKTQDAVSRVHYLITQFPVISTYVRLLVLPVGQTLDYDYPLYTSLANPRGLASLGLIVCMIAGCILMYMRGMRAGAFCVAWFFIALSVEAGFIALEDLIFEHRLYLPMFGLAMGAGLVIAHAMRGGARPRPWVTAAVLCMIALLGTATYARNAEWSDEIRFYEDMAWKAPHKARVLYNLGRAYEDEGLGENAFSAYRRAMQGEPRLPQPYESAGLMLQRAGRIEDAIAYYEAALEISPERADALSHLGTAYIEAGRIKDAIRRLEAAVALDAGKAEYLSNLAMAYYRAGRLDMALAASEDALAIEPSNVTTLTNYAEYLETVGRRDEAMRLRQALSEQGP